MGATDAGSEDDDMFERVEVPFSYVVVLDTEGSLRFVNTTCGICGEWGYKNPLTDAWEHARGHLGGGGS